MEKIKVMKQQRVKPEVSNVPNYKKIYTDLITTKYPHLLKSCSSFLRKDQLLAYDIIKISKIITEKGDKEAILFNSKHKTYDLQTYL
ncbi:hypothetical protein J2W57_001781 [Chryseobacterium ginsenosidimutans]|jgi:hypothetical protein|uniref:Uncharacterized protein n=1 Tax=Chryseobacterium geocarposphaerae TaxID=1416776 RepID=A0ABU1LBJ1_9FLAO|nr:hypothetical protein [Chryseobacterium geocarposphaerae]MDR6698409.1 hypothetical protein [Chryseobacterium ginsenosidimutans]